MINIPCMYGICQQQEQYGCNNANIEFSVEKGEIKELKRGVIQLKTAFLSNPRVGSDGLGFKPGKKQTY